MCTAENGNIWIHVHTLVYYATFLDIGIGNRTQYRNKKGYGNLTWNSTCWQNSKLGLEVTAGFQVKQAHADAFPVATVNKSSMRGLKGSSVSAKENR